MNTANAGDGISAELFQILKDDAVKSAALNISANLGKLSSSHRTGNVSFHLNSKEGQCQRMFKLPHNCTHVIC